MAGYGLEVLLCFDVDGSGTNFAWDDGLLATALFSFIPFFRVPPSLLENSRRPSVDKNHLLAERMKAIAPTILTCVGAQAETT